MGNRYQAVQEWDDFGKVIDTSKSAVGVPGVHVSTHRDVFEAQKEAQRLNGQDY